MSNTITKPLNVIEAAFVCYPVKDLARARNFYENVLGLSSSSDMSTGESSWVEYDVNGTTLAIGSHEGWEPSTNGPSISLEVDDFDLSVQKLADANIAIVMGPIETPVCHMALINDSEGNSIFIHKRKANH